MSDNKHDAGRDASGMSMRYYWDVAVRRSWLLAVVFAGVAAAVFLAALVERPEYQASASLLIGQEDGNAGRVSLFGRDGAGWSARGPNLANHIEMLRSRTLAKMALDALPGQAREQLARGGQGEPQRVQRLVSARPVRDADVIRLAVRAPSPELARELAEAYAAAYQEFSLTRSRADVSAVRSFVELQLTAAAARLDSAETGLERYKRSQGVADIAEETKALVERQTGVLVRYQEMSAERAGLEQKVGYLRSELEGLGVAAGANRDNATGTPIAGLADEQAALQAERSNLLVTGYGETSPRVAALARRQRAVNERLSAELARFPDLAGASAPGQAQAAIDQIFSLEPQLAEARAAETTLAGQVDRYDRELDRLPAKERALARLTRDVEVNRQVYSLLAQRREEARIQEAGRISSIGVVDPPQDGVKTKPNLRNSALMALLLGLCVSMAAVLTVDRLDNKVRRPEDLERQGFSVLANVPRFAAQAGLATRAEAEPGRGDEQQEAIVSAAEAFRVLRTNIQFAAAGRATRRLLVTSAGASEGKTTVAANLATVLAQSGKKTLLVDADLRRPRQHVLFGLRKKPGITDAALLGIPLEQAIRPGPVEGLSLLCAGTLPPSPVDFLNSVPFAKLLEQLAGRYECVLLDSPPVLVSADAAVLASKLDGVVLVARMGQADRRALAEAQKVLSQAGARVIGFVANDLKPRPAYGYYRYRYHYYHYQYRDALGTAKT